jgi:hypothetical protein
MHANIRVCCCCCHILNAAAWPQLLQELLHPLLCWHMPEHHISRKQLRQQLLHLPCTQAAAAADVR